MADLWARDFRENDLIPYFKLITERGQAAQMEPLFLSAVVQEKAKYTVGHPLVGRDFFGKYSRSNELCFGSR